MSKIAQKYGWEAVVLGAAWLVESLLNIGTTIVGWFS